MHIFLLLLALFTLLVFPLKGQHTISGRVLAQSDSLNSGLPGVSVLVVGTERGTITDYNGDYKIEVSENGILNFSYVGFVDQQIPVGNKSIIDVMLQEDVKKLNEVVVTAMSITREVRSISYSVSEVSGEEFTMARENNLGDALAGRVAGVNVSNIATGPTGASRVVIRGVVSMTQNNQPLYVIDGMPIDNTTFQQAGMWGGADWGDGTTSINPDDIETISVLKGANASALYGSRASNGVVLITTIKGKKQKGIGIEINSNFVMESVIDYIDPQTQYGHGNFGAKPNTPRTGFDFTNQAWGAELDGSMSYTFDGVERPYINTFVEGASNIKKFFQNGFTWTNSIAVTGGSERQQTRFSLSHLNNQGIIPNSGFERLNLGLNYLGKYGNFEIESKIFYIKEDAKNRPLVSDSPGNANLTASLLPVSVDIKTLRGDPDKPGAIYSEQSNPPDITKNEGEELAPNQNKYLTNPYWAAYQFANDGTRNRVIGQVRAKYNFTENLYAQIKIGLDWQYNQRKDLVPYGTSYRREGSLNEGQMQIQETNYEWMAGYQRMWNQFGIHGFVGGNALRRWEETFWYEYSGFNIPFFHTSSNIPLSLKNYIYNSKGINSLFGSLEVSWGGYLYLTATARNDWFSTLDQSKNSILYPSVGVSWVFSDLFSMPTWWNSGKFRISWAQVGGDTSPYNLDQTYSLYYTEGHLERKLAQISQTINPNRDLVPLTSTEVEMGLDIGFFHNRLGLDISFYKQVTKDDIIRVSIPFSSGYEQTWINVGDMENKGYEFFISATPVKKDLLWNIEINYAENHNKVIKISDEIGKVIGNGQWLTESRTRRAFLGYWEGEPYGVISGYKQKTVNGQNEIDPVTGNPVSNEFVEIIGYGIHPYTGGINNTFSYKGCSLSFLLDIKLGADIHSGTNDNMTQLGLHKQTLFGRTAGLLSTGVDITGETKNVLVSKQNLQSYWNKYTDISDNFVYDASFIRLKEVILGFTFPDQWLVKTPFSYMNFSLVGRNLALLYRKTENIDPESTYNNLSVQGLEYSGVPPSRTYGFNMKFQF